MQMNISYRKCEFDKIDKKLKSVGKPLYNNTFNELHNSLTIGKLI